MDNYIENHFVTFIHILRKSGVTVGISQILDSLEVLSVLDITDREQVYAGLSAVLAKNPHEQEIFHDAFDVFFVPRNVRDKQMENFEEHQQELDQIKEELVFQEEQLEVSEKDMQTYSSLSEEERRKIQDFLDKASNGANMTPDHRGMIEAQIHSLLQRLRDNMGGAQFQTVETTGVAMWDALLYDMQQQRNDEDLMLKDISEIRDNEMEAAVVMIRQLARRLANRIGRRHRISSTVHAVDIRRSVRSSLRYGGVLMELKYRKPRIQKPTIVLIADVSGSMLKYSSFLLELMYGLSTVLPNIRSYVFAEKLKRLDLHEFNIDKFSHDKELGDGTNLYDSLLDFRADYDTMLNKKTVLIVLSDAKTIEYKKAAEEIESLSERVKEILWLNPMPADEWNRFVQTKAMMPYVTMLEASSIQKLTKAVRDI